MARRSILLLIAVLIAAIGTTLIVLYVRGIDERAQAGQDLVEVLVATEVIDTGETLEDAVAEAKVVREDLVRDSVAPSAVSLIETLEGQVALSPIYPGEPIIRERFGAPGEQQTLRIPQGLMAISVELSDPARVAGFVPNGAEVAIFVSADPVRFTADGEQRLPSVTRVLLPRVPVLGSGETSTSSTVTDQSDAEQDQEEVPRTIMTIAVTQDQAEKVIYAARNGDLTFALLRPDSEVSDGPGVEGRDVLPETLR
jgi:pilus assembly protein CpaB